MESHEPEHKGSHKKDPFKIIFVLIFLSMTLGAFTHCVIEPPKSATKRNSRTTSSVSDPVNNTPSNPTPGNPTPAPTPGTPVTPIGNPGRDFFEQTVLQNFQNNCMVCHADPSTNPPLPGPLSIYNYDSMRVQVLNGNSGADNQLINKIQGIIGHAGGNRCPGGVTDTVCQVVVDWYTQEMTQTSPPNPPAPTPTPPPVNVNGVTGAISVISSTGKVTGYAGDAADPNRTIGVTFYIDGPSGAGIQLNNAPIQANLAGFNGGIPGAHAFNYFIPILYRDGLAHQLYAYGDNNGIEVELQGSPYNFTAYTSTVEGFNYYTGTVKPLLDQQCIGCHAFSYDQNFSSLLTPSPANGGSMTNNEMINMPSGSSMGVNHPGGNICGSRDNSPCVELQMWWDLEFN